MRALALALLVATASSLEAQRARPPLNAGRVAGELAVGTYAGIGGFLVGRFVGERMADILGAERDATMRAVGLTSGVAVAGLATAGSVYGIGNIGDQTGDFSATYLGTGVGFAAGWALSRALLGPSERPREGMSTAARWATANVIALLPSIGATVGFNSSRRYK
ncbi:hypothetical protein Strain138_001088 [Pseudogemmatithrix spongiicola]|uniref:Uncharacterized protein n=1 Tax=Pseudogemmatithrix spongiicola TaxID=3062599 RepID=A0AA49JZN9_9BACT|nr:hypothetical protein Strain138_001088 [Gemmatimonadaceae bacterium 'strain 138']WKW14732.1 hypothetical protein Strain318_001088 [Gemmatimonadaceae bacterium 'strain 318']